MPSPKVSTTALVRTWDTMLRTLDRGDRHPVLLLTIVLLLDVFLALQISLTSPMWHDELFTYAISQAKTLHDLQLQISTVDLNPPLSYLLTRASFRLFGAGTLQCRLPEMLGFLLALASTFVFVGRRAGNSSGVLACSLLLATSAVEATIQARPYGLMLGFTALALVAWQNSTIAEAKGRPSWGHDLLLTVALSLLLLSHVFGLLGWLTIVLAEGVLALQRRRLSSMRSAALLPPLAVTLLYAPLVRDHGSSLFPPAFQPHLFTIVSYYAHILSRRGIALWLAIAIVILLRKNRGVPRPADLTFTLPEWAAAFALFLLPAMLMLRLMLQHASFFNRYGLLACLGLAMLVAVIFQWSARGRPAAALIAAVLVLLLSGRLTSAARAAISGSVFRHTEPVTGPAHLELLPDPSLPIVDASGLTFVEMNYREPPGILSRTWYLTGGDLAVQYAHATIFESMALEKQMFQFRSNVDTFQHFTQVHKHFYVLGTIDYPEDWLLRKLVADGATLVRLRQHLTDYHDSSVYDVTLSK